MKMIFYLKEVHKISHFNGIIEKKKQKLNIIIIKKSKYFLRNKKIRKYFMS